MISCVLVVLSSVAFERSAALAALLVGFVASPLACSALGVVAGGAAGATGGRFRGSGGKASALPIGCGAAPTYAHAKPNNYADSKKTFYNTTSKQTEDVSFGAGDKIEFKCEAGYTTDGSKDGSDLFETECTELGYFKTQGSCVEASKCGALPNVSHALPTGKTTPAGVEFACAQGYSLDGEKVVAGGLGRNRFFSLKCIEFTGAYEKFTGECKPYAFVASGETTRIYNQVAEALFIVSCKGTLKTSFAKGELPSGIDKACSSFEDSSAACQGLVSKIKGEFESELQARKEHDENAKKDWHEEKDPDRPGIGDEAQTFCTELWQLLEMPAF